MKKKSFVVIVIFLILIILGLCAFIVYDKGLFGNKEKVTNNTVEKSKKEENVTSEKNANDKNVINNISDLVLDSNKCINNKNMIYNLTTNFDINGVNITYNGDYVYIGIDSNVVRSSYNGIELNNSSYSIKSDKKIVDIYVDGFGQSIGYETILFLMEDGTVEYIPFYYACKNDNFQSFKLDGVDNIIRFLSVNVHPNTEGGGSGHSILAQKQDGSFYDISSMLKDTQYYNNF